MNEIVLAHKLERDGLLEGKYVQRDGLQEAKKGMQSNLIKVITGPRRAGKSVFAIQILQGLDFSYINFDDERLLNISDYEEILKAMREVYGETRYVLFDEIQNLRSWEVFINRLQRKGLNIVITGSNAHLLSRELSTHLTGRYIQFQIFPFSFIEFLRARDFAVDDNLKIKERQGLLLNCLDEYLKSGGYPEVVVKNAEAKNYLTTLFESILFKDVTKRWNVRYTKKLHDLGHYLITNHSGEFSYTRLKNVLSFRSVHTVENYVSYLIEAFIIFDINRFSYKLKEQLRSPQKVYAYDTGMINAVKFTVTRDTGKLIENAVAIELLRRGIEPYYYKTVSGKEIDFVIRHGSEIKELIQVCYNPEDHETKKREVNALIKSSKELKCDNLLIISWDYAGEETFADKKVVFLPLWRWLTGK